jgi:acetyltransferase-like isoleucine patch superfamily enzyme
MKLGPGLTTGRGLRLEAFQSQGDTPTLTIGRDVQLNDYVHIAAACSVVIGDRVLIASRVFITDHQHGSYSGSGPQDHPWSAPAERPLTCEPVWIEDDVWIGEGVCILPGVRIGRGAVVGANSTVTRDVPAQTIVAGSPAHIVKLFCIATATWERV